MISTPKNNFFDIYIDKISTAVATCVHDELMSSAHMFLHSNGSSKKVILAGNGGSAAMASHVAVDLTKACGIRAVNFNEADLITCFANDYGYENWVSEALRAYADPGDCVVLISSSGQSKNIINAAIQSKTIGCSLLTLSGFRSDNPLRKLGDVNLWVDSSNYNIVEMTHHIWLLSIVDFIVESQK
jgi:D-sedoheptulose 7-phosphate isomerase